MSDSVRLLLLARTGTSAAPIRELERLCEEATRLPGIVSARHAFIEEGTPSLRDVLLEMVEDITPILIAPAMLPAEATLEGWLRRTLKRLQAKSARPWPEIRLAPPPGDQPAMGALLAQALTSDRIKTLDIENATLPEGSIVPAQKRRVLVCMGGPCNAVGAALIWGHLRNEQKRLGLRTAGEGAMSAKTSCLGPCSLAPVVQVWPEGTLYGGVDETGIDRIVQSHLLNGEPVADLVYGPTGAKQKLRA